MRKSDGEKKISCDDVKDTNVNNAIPDFPKYRSASSTDPVTAQHEHDDGCDNFDKNDMVDKEKPLRENFYNDHHKRFELDDTESNLNNKHPGKHVS